MALAQQIRLSDYIAQTLVAHGVSHVFMLTGGGAMHLNDAFGRTEGLNYVCCHHEQACAMAAEAYTRLSGRLAALNVTTGPGGINALNGIHGAYTDSIGMIVVSGQVKLLKPDPAIYFLALDRFGLKPAEALFIDDREINVEGALAVGMKAHLFVDAEDLRARLAAEGLL